MPETTQLSGQFLSGGSRRAVTGNALDHSAIRKDSSGKRQRVVRGDTRDYSAIRAVPQWSACSHRLCFRPLGFEGRPNSLVGGHHCESCASLLSESAKSSEHSVCSCISALPTRNSWNSFLWSLASDTYTGKLTK